MVKYALFDSKWSELTDWDLHLFIMELSELLGFLLMSSGDIGKGLPPSYVLKGDGH